jgi:hypothetical protein
MVKTEKSTSRIGHLNDLAELYDPAKIIEEFNRVPKNY